MSDRNRGLNARLPNMIGSRMIPPVNQAGVPPVAIGSMVSNQYNLVAAQPHQFMPHLAYNQLPNVPNRMPIVRTIPPNMPGMYVPVAQVAGPPVLATQLPTVQVPPGVVSPNVDPSKFLEQQRKMEKERNFQLQQQRLKQFTVAGKKGSINADNLIDSMFGKSHSKENIPHSTTYQSKPKESSEMKKTHVIVNSPAIPSQIPLENTHTKPLSACPTSLINPSCGLTTKQDKRDKKELDAMMLECSNLSGPHKANKFSKPPVKEITPTTQYRSTFASSNKARNWKDIKGLNEVFVEKRSRFPPWCCSEKVPEMFHKIEAIVTENGAHTPETNLLFPILLSSGLPQQSLAQIWEMVNQSASGYLTAEEMYAALALIAVLQCGHPVTTVDILHKLPSCPVPRLQCFMSPIEGGSVDKSPTQQTTEASGTPPDSNRIPALPVHQAVRPNAIDLRKGSQPGPDTSIAAEKYSSLPYSTGFISSPDDEFDDFKSATPTCVNFMMHPSSTAGSTPQEDEFDDFKQAPPVGINLPGGMKSTNITSATKPVVPEQDLMSPDEDKYSVFRDLQQSENTDDWADFSSNSFDSTNHATTGTLENSSDFKACFDSVETGEESLHPEVSTHERTKVEDEFGDFLCAEAKKEQNVTNLTSDFKNMSTNFADFSSFNHNPSAVPTFSVSGNSQIDDEFGEFTSSLPVSSKAELGQEFLFRHLKDNISLASESQSVSSLELGTFDGGGHSGESKSSLSRQGSIPSLDLKSSCLEMNDGDDCFGDFQNAPVVNRVSTTPSPVKDVKGIEINNSSGISIGSNFQPPQIVPLTDKYSIIRSEEKKDEDQHISSWTHCLQSSVNILQNTYKIFNQMSCSSVCKEVLQSEEGGNYVKDVIEVYKVACRIKFSSKSYNKQNKIILDLLKDVEKHWSNVSVFFAGSSLMPEESSFEFSPALLRSDSEDNTKACGLCLLNVDVKSSNNDDCSLKLSYGGRNYHSTCANFWVNCVDPLLPALILPQLL